MENKLKSAALATRIYAIAGILLSLVVAVIVLMRPDPAPGERQRAAGGAIIYMALLAALHVVNLLQVGKLATGDTKARNVIRGCTIALIVLGILAGPLSWLVNVIGGAVVLVLVWKAMSPERGTASPPVVS